MRTPTHHITRSIAIALAVGAVTAPAAAAQQVMPMPDTRDAAKQAERRQGGAVQPERQQVTPMPDTRDWAAGRGPDKAPVVEFVEVREPNGFDVADAGLGAAAGIGLVLIGAGTAVTAARVRRRSPGTARA